MKASECRGVLVLLPAGQRSLDRLDLPGLVGNVRCVHHLLARACQRAHQRDAERARDAESRAGRRVAARGQRESTQHGEPAQGSREQRQFAVRNESTGVRTLERFRELLGHEPQEFAAQVQLDVRPERNRTVDDDAAFTGRKRRDVGPSPGKVEPQGRRRMKRRGEVPASHGCTRQAATVGNSPRTSIRTPRTRLFIAWTPRAWYSQTTGSCSAKTRCAAIGSTGIGTPVRFPSGCRKPSPGSPGMPVTAAVKSWRAPYTRSKNAEFSSWRIVTLKPTAASRA